MRGVGVALVLLLLPVAAGCLSRSAEKLEAQSVLVPPNVARWIDEMDDVAWDISGNYSRTLTKGVFEVLPVEHIDLATHDETRISMAVWRPDVPAGTKVPVILDVGPYYGDVIDEIVGGREKEFFLDQFVANGFAYGRVAIRGTSSSGGCMEFFSENEQKDVDAAVTHFGTAEWSNGNVALYGASYDGTTPWIAASFGNPHLKTIVPVSGLTDVAELMFRNGTSESRGTIMHSVVYWPFGFETLSRSPADKIENFCEEAVRGFAAGPYTYLTGDRETPGPVAGYWEARDWREKVKANYKGSVLLVHGLQDWNVEATMSYPFVNELEAQGIAVKHMLGQWGHDWPDRASREDHIRWDWGEMLVRWFDRELRGNTAANPGPNADVEDNYGLWRIEASWPPKDAVQTSYYLGAGVLATEPQSDGSVRVVNPGAAVGRNGVMVPFMGGTPLTEAVFDLGRLDADLRFAGLAHLPLTVVPSNAHGGNLYVELLDVGRGGQVKRAAHAVMNLRFYAGGIEPQTLTPGRPVVTEIEFFPADVLVPAGHRLVLRVVPDTGSGTDGMHESPTPTPIEIQWGGEKSVLRLPIIDRDVGAGMYAGQPRPR
ncbi:MAG: CocE/NonD family hydrolase [Methanobacteriota archaeon]